MATITPSTTYTDGAVLDIAGHNANIYSTTSGKGVLSEPNGGLEQVNLDPGPAFAVAAEHVMSEEAVMARQESTTTPMDLFSNAFGDAGQTEDDLIEKSYVTIAGLAQRVHLPFTMSAVLWQWSFFANVYRADMGELSRDAIIIRAYLDGNPISSFTRPLVVSAVLETAGSGFTSYPLAFNYEDSTAMWYDFSKLSTNVSAGYHELSVKVYMERSNRRTNASSLSLIPDSEGADPSYLYRVYSRTTFGVRNVRCVSFK